MKTAVEWFAKELNNWRIKEFGEDSIIGIPQDVFEKAKQMEKEQIMDAWFDGVTNWDSEKEVEDYIKETFKSE